MKFIRAIVTLTAAFFIFSASLAEARGRTGSYRIGGSNSHGSGGHYWGGR